MHNLPIVADCLSILVVFILQISTTRQQLIKYVDLEYRDKMIHDPITVVVLFELFFVIHSF